MAELDRRTRFATELKDLKLRIGRRVSNQQIIERANEILLADHQRNLNSDKALRATKPKLMPSKLPPPKPIGSRRALEGWLNQGKIPSWDHLWAVVRAVAGFAELGHAQIESKWRRLHAEAAQTPRSQASNSAAEGHRGISASPYILEPVVPAPQNFDVDWLLQQPSRVLDARSQIVNFGGRLAEMARLIDWRDSERNGLSVRLLHGPGGQGKTRLAHHLADVSRKAGWTVVAARLVHGLRDHPHTVEDAHEPSNKLLLVVDYADRWSHTELLTLFSDPLLRGERARVLLVGRSVQWWPAMRGELAEAYATADEQQLDALAPSIVEREAEFTRARDRFGELFGVQDLGVIKPPRPLTGPTFDLVLSLHMAALVAVDASIRGQTPPTEPAGLAAYLLDREYMNWRRLYGTRTLGEEFETPPTIMARAVFTAVLTGAVPYQVATDALTAAALTPSMRILSDHRVCYPPVDRALTLEPLFPDRLAEDFLALLTPGHEVSGYDPDPWTTDLLTKLLAATGADSVPSFAVRATTFLAAAAVRWPHLSGVVSDLVRTHPMTVLNSGNTALTTVAEIPGLDTSALEVLVKNFPSDRNVDLDPGIAAITERFVQHRLTFTDDPLKRITLYQTLGGRLYSAGRYEDALAAVRRAQSLIEGSAPPDVEYQSALAGIYTNISVYLAKLGRDKETLEASKSALDLYRTLALVDPAIYTPDVAMALHNYSVDLADSGQYEDGLRAAKESLSIYQELALSDSEEYEPDVALGFYNVSVKLARLGHSEEEFEVAQQSLEMHRKLYKSNPQKHASELALALQGASITLSTMGLRWEALAPARESLELYRTLTQTNPTAFEEDLADALTTLGTRLAEIGLFEEAFTNTDKALSIYRHLESIGYREQYTLSLAHTLVNHACQLDNLKRFEPAFSSAKSGLSLLRRLAPIEEARFGGVFGWSLQIAGEIACNMKRFNDGLPLLREAIVVQRQLATERPLRYESQLADSLTILGKALSGAGEASDAFDAIDEALGIYRRLMARRSRAYSADIATCLSFYGELRLNSGYQLHEALVAVGESIDILEKLTEEVPLLFADRLSETRQLYLQISNSLSG
ncbi:hypothetical protein [Rhodococcus sp. 077-4]|uniref:tetratricopeptide repeat protein n=1 Tax=Rhodococcus sp. 077-4 TaxID=2789271 RepID=UPI0039F58018